MFVYVRVPESQSPKHHGNFLKKQCLVPHISETIELNQKRLKNLLFNFLCSFQIHKDPLSDIGTFKPIPPPSLASWPTEKCFSNPYSFPTQPQILDTLRRTSPRSQAPESYFTIPKKTFYAMISQMVMPCMLPT